MQFDVGESVMAKWPGSKLFYIAKIQLARAEDNEYDVEYENGSVFTIPAKDTYKQNSVSFRKAIHSNRSKSKSRARSKGRAQRTKKKVDLGDESSADESLPVEEVEKKASNSSRVSRKSAVPTPVASPRASNSSKVSGRDPKASNSSRMSSRSKRVSNTSLMSNKATTDAFSEEEDDDLGMLSVSARASRSSQVAPENESELELLATDQTQLSEEAELAPNATAARASISSRISSLIFGASTPRPAEADTPDRVSLDSVSEDDDAEDSLNASGKPSASSKKASVSSRISSMLFGDSSLPKSPSTSSKIEEATEDAKTSSKRASASSGTSTKEYDSLVLRNRTVTETLSPLSELGQDDEENEAPAADSSTAAGLTEDEEDNGPQPVSARASASSRKASASSKKASVSSRVSIASKKASTSSRLSQKEELVESAEEEAAADVTEEMESSEKTSNVDKASISSRISNILFGGTPKASTSSKISETNGTQPVKIIEDLAAAEVSSFPFISTRRSSRASTRASTIASNSSVRQSASPNRSGGLDEFSEDEEKAEPAAGEPQSANEEKTEAPPSSSSWSVEWVWAIFFMLLCPAILVSLHTICTGHVCNLAVPRLSIDPKDYVDYEAVGMVLSFALLLRLLEFFCIGKEVQGYRMNGFQSLLLVLALVPTLTYHGVDLGKITAKYFHLMCATILLSYCQAIVSLALSHGADPASLSAKGNTGNPLVNLFHGRQLNPTLLGANLKLQTFRCSMIGLALLNTLLVAEASMATQINPTVVIAATYQILYAMDAMYYEECYFYSHDSLYSGYGWSLISSYLTFPFLPTLVTRYLVGVSPSLSWTALAAISAMNLLGYYIYRSSENQRCQLAKDPAHPSLAHLQTLETIKGRRLIVSGWWGLVRHPNYLGELLVQWSWVLPAAPTLGLTQLVPYYLPVVTTLMLVLRCLQINKRNGKKFGDAWSEYTGRVKANIIPCVF